MDDSLQKAKEILEGSPKDVKKQVGEFAGILNSKSKEITDEKAIDKKIDELLNSFNDEAEEFLKNQYNVDKDGLKSMLKETVLKTRELGIQVDVFKLIDSALASIED